MNVEIERKFLVNKEKFEESLLNEKWISYPVKQGYFGLADEPDVSLIRVAIIGHENYEMLKKFNPEEYHPPKARIVFKGPLKGCTRDEFEYKIPLEDGLKLFEMCNHKLYKERYKATLNGFLWEVDVYKLENEGLIIAEVEIPSPDTEIIKPDFIMTEVTEIQSYYNVNLATCSKCVRQR